MGVKINHIPSTARDQLRGRQSRALPEAPAPIEESDRSRAANADMANVRNAGGTGLGPTVGKVWSDMEKQWADGVPGTDQNRPAGNGF